MENFTLIYIDVDKIKLANDIKKDKTEVAYNEDVQWVTWKDKDNKKVKATF